MCATLIVSAATLAIRASSHRRPARSLKPPDEDWKPEKIENLKVLPEDDDARTDDDDHEGVQRGAQRRVHLLPQGQDRAPLSTFDFPDDSKEHKEVTRNMLTMTNDINTKYPEGMGDDASVESAEGDVRDLPSPQPHAGDGSPAERCQVSHGPDLAGEPRRI